MIPEINKRHTNDILYIRRSKGISQNKLAKALDIPRYKLSYFENGHELPTKEILNKMMKELNCLASELYLPKEQKIILEEQN